MARLRHGRASAILVFAAAACGARTGLVTLGEAPADGGPAPDVASALRAALRKLSKQ